LAFHGLYFAKLVQQNAGRIRHIYWELRARLFGRRSS
jgi:hypothetical protein